MGDETLVTPQLPTEPAAKRTAAARPDPRYNQRLRTRQALITAARTLSEAGRTPTIPEAADAALVSRATAYRYFPTQAVLLIEAALLPSLPLAEEVFGRPDAPGDPCDRIVVVSDLIFQHISAREKEFRLFQREQLLRASDRKAQAGLGLPLIDAALEPLSGTLADPALRRLKHMLSVLIGAEAVFACRDVLQLDDATARAELAWACRSLVEDALVDAAP